MGSPEDSGLHFASEEEIRQGKVADVYFLRTREILNALGIRKKVKVELTAKSFPRDWQWGLFAGLGEVVSLLSGMDVDLWAMDEGSVFYREEPFLVIEGDYIEFGIFETSILGLVCQASGIATVSARYRMAAGNKTIISFGARRMHPVIAPMIERYAYVGGCDGVAVVKSAEALDIEPVGTMPHALVLTIGDLDGALKAFDKVVDPSIPRIALIDTFGDEKFEAIKACEILGKSLYAVRLDTPSSRRGNFARIIEEVRWELDLRGFENVKILVSGGINEATVRELNDIVDGYGIGTSISNAPVIDCAMDIVEVDGVPLAKRGKKSGAKAVYRCEDHLHSLILPDRNIPPALCSCGSPLKPALSKILTGGKLEAELPRPKSIREHVLHQLTKL
ncbi:MAG: nicotinate phosphoribosyltransferase [Candidatus Glassbacteria bacterium]